ncbi:MAG: hypothetical protein U1F43_01760 [Myxococcota bacterium]
MIALAPTADACRACRTRDCCFDREVDLTGADVVRIAAALEVAPSTFATALPAPADDARAFALGAGRARLVLAQRAEPDGRRACVFLLGLGSGRRLCGLGELAPTACRLHPSSADGPGACWRTFTADEVAPARRALADRLDAERGAWRARVAAWNEAMAARGGGRRAALDVFLDHVLARAAEP